jgi:predicted negative regulator of RcsB-dependent stress response
MAAINAAGYDDGLDSPLNKQYQIRNQIREELAKKTIPSLPELKAFYQAHKKSSGAADLGQYISFALVAGAPPTFELPAGALPPDVMELKDFAPLLARFYNEAGLNDLWKRSQPAYARTIAEYQDAVINSIFEANGYVRNASGYLGRRFRIYLELQGQPNQIQVRNYRDDYFVVITPTAAPVVDEVRDAYLAYLLDPLSFKYRLVINEKSGLEKIAEQAPALDQAYKHDFSLLVTKSLIKAIDARLMHGDADKRTVYINQATREGFILTAAFSELLGVYEKQQEALRMYYPDLIAAIDVKKEQKRFRDFEFAKTAAPRVMAPAAARQQMGLAEETLESAEGLYEQEQYADAERLYKKVFEQTADKQLHGRAYYRLGLIAIRENRKDEAVQMFERTVEANPDPVITAWSHVYLGRLAQATGDSGKANEQFKLALNIDGASALAKQAAAKGLQSSSTGEKQQ